MLINYLSILCDSARHEIKHSSEGRAWPGANDKLANSSPVTQDYGTAVFMPGILKCVKPNMPEEQGEGSVFSALPAKNRAQGGIRKS